MTRAIVHKTKGKLDLRSLTVFGLNAKPTTDTPIGYFGTGLKYAVAVLARHNIAVTFWIDGKKWTVEQDDTKFRDKTFRALSLKTMRGKILSPKVISLPFTTELGKNWELWQAFRELEANTRDEKGTTYLQNTNEPYEWHDSGGYTHIEIRGEEYVQEFFDKDKIFLPDGLTSLDGSEFIQVFARKSTAVYYRSIRIHDLKEPSENTYNILSRIELTEDRTAKNYYEIELAIEHFLTSTKNVDVIKRAVTAPLKSYERKLSYDYSSRSKQFLDTVDSAGEDATEHAKSILGRDRPPERPMETYTNWIRDLIAAIERGDNDRVKEVTDDNRAQLLDILRTAAQAKEEEDDDNSQGSESHLDTELVDRGARSGRFTSDGSHIEEVEPSEGHPGQYVQQANITRPDGSQPRVVFILDQAHPNADGDNKAAKDDDIPF